MWSLLQQVADLPPALGSQQKIDHGAVLKWFRHFGEHILDRVDDCHATSSDKWRLIAAAIPIPHQSCQPAFQLHHVRTVAQTRPPLCKSTKPTWRAPEPAAQN